MTYEQHLRKAEECDECLEYLLKSDHHWAWIAVAAAYSALHHVDAVIDIIPSSLFNPGSHGERSRALATHPDLKRNLMRDYDVVKSIGHGARYKVGPVDRRLVIGAVLPRLQTIKDYQRKISQQFAP